MKNYTNCFGFETNEIAGKDFGLSDNGLAKICKLAVAKPPRGYWAKVDELFKMRETVRPDAQQYRALPNHS